MQGEINVMEVMARTERLKVWRSRQSRNAERSRQGVITVAEIIEREARLSAWRERMARDSEWVALKQWWADCRAEQRAVTAKQRIEAAKGKQRTRELYGATLVRAQKRWRRAQAEYRRRGGYRLGWG